MCLLKKIWRIEESTKKKIKFNSNSTNRKYSSDNHYSVQKPIFYNRYTTCLSKANYKLTCILNCKVEKH